MVDSTVPRENPLRFDPPEPAPDRARNLVSIWDSVRRIQTNPLTVVPASVYREPFLQQRLLGQRFAFVCDPVLADQVMQDVDSFPKSELQNRIFRAFAQNGLLTTEGEHWRAQRRTSSPAFRRRTLIDFVPAMDAAARASATALPADGPFNVFDHTAHFTLDVLARTLFRDEPHFDSAAFARLVNTFLESIGDVSVLDLVGVPYVVRPGKWAGLRAAKSLRDLIDTPIARRLEQGEPGGDLLGILLAAKDPQTNEPMPRDEIIDNVMTFIGAGHETTAGALSWALYVLSHTSDLQDRIAEEAAAFTGTEDPAEVLPLTLRVLKETLRLFPSAPDVIRSAAKDVVLDGHEIRNGTHVIVPIYVLHRHEAIWEAPSHFDPDRFLPEREAARHRCAFMPFGAGPRICIGAGFALLEGTIALARYVQACRFRLSETAPRPMPISRVTLRSQPPVMVVAAPR